MAITNGTFDTDLSGWTIVTDADATVTWKSPGIARLELTGAGIPYPHCEIKQSFVIDDIAIYFQYRCTGNNVYNHWPAWKLTVDISGVPTDVFNESLNNNYWGSPWITWTRVVDVSMYSGNTATISFYDDDYWGGNSQVIEIDNVGVGKAGSVEFITDPPGANIWLKDMDGTLKEWWNYTGDGYKIDPWITPFTASQMISQDYILKLCGYNDYTDTLTMVDSIATVNTTLTPTYTDVNLITYPYGAEIYLDGIDLGIKTPAMISILPTPFCVHEFIFRRSGYFDSIRTETLVGQGPITIYIDMISLIPIPPCP